MDVNTGLLQGHMLQERGVGDVGGGGEGATRGRNSRTCLTIMRVACMMPWYSRLPIFPACTVSLPLTISRG